MKAIVLCGLLSLLYLAGFGTSYINYFMLHAGIRYSLEEQSRQSKIRDNQLIDSELEESNRQGFSDFSKQYRKIESRLNSLGLLIDAGLMVGQLAAPVSSIRKSQGEILQLLTEQPALLLQAAQVERELAEKAVSILGLVAGILLTYGELNRMKAGDRRLLLNHARDELRALDAQSYRLLRCLQQRLSLSSGERNSFNSWVNPERKLLDEIIRNARQR